MYECLLVSVSSGPKLICHEFWCWLPEAPLCLTWPIKRIQILLPCPRVQDNPVLVWPCILVQSAGYWISLPGYSCLALACHFGACLQKWMMGGGWEWRGCEEAHCAVLAHLSWALWRDTAADIFACTHSESCGTHCELFIAGPTSSCGQIWHQPALSLTCCPLAGLQQSGGWGLKKPLAWPSFFKYFWQLKEK